MSIFLDIKYAIRQLFKTPKFTAITLFVLVGGLTISLFTFSFLYSLIYKPLPLPGGESIFRLSISTNGDGRSIPAYELLEAKQGLQSIEHLEVFETTDFRISQQDVGKTLTGTYVENEIFSFTQTQPILGRGFTPEDMLSSAAPTVVLSHSTWQREYSEDSNIVGKVIRINDLPTTVIGIMPQGYHFPVNSQLWLPLPQRLKSLTADTREYIQAYGRVKPTFSKEQAELEIGQAMDAIYQQTARQFQKPEGKLAATLYTFPHAQTDGDGNLVFTFFNLIAFSILLLACINVGNLLLARAIERSKETAIRAALGAPTNRLVLQLMWEGIIITLLGSLLAVLLVSDLLDYTDALLHAEVSENLPFWWRWGMDVPTLLMAIGFTIVTIVLASFIPAWRSAKQDINSTLRDGTRGAQGKKAGKMSRILVTVQIFLISTLMLIGSISAFLSQYLLNMDTIEDYTRVIHGGIFLTDKNYKTPEQKIRFFEDFYDRLKRKHNVENAVVRGYFGTSELVLDGEDSGAQNQFPKIDTMSLIGNTEFFSAQLVEGRHLDKRDNPNAP
ncbi:MAG: ABC transporter permease, partial [Kangiellaceae bacterium]|nr:ABC transporter permease [Kangiellaceae bacterium]